MPGCVMSPLPPSAAAPPWSPPAPAPADEGVLPAEPLALPPPVPAAFPLSACAPPTPPPPLPAAGFTSGPPSRVPASGGLPVVAGEAEQALSANTTQAAIASLRLITVEGYGSVLGCRARRVRTGRRLTDTSALVPQPSAHGVRVANKTMASPRRARRGRAREHVLRRPGRDTRGRAGCRRRRRAVCARLHNFYGESRW